MPPEPLPLSDRGATIEADARLSVAGTLWAPVLTVEWIHPQTGAGHRTAIPNVPPELFSTAEEARARAVFHGRNWVDRQGALTRP